MLRLYDLLYPETEALVVPEVDSPDCVRKMAALCIWVQIRRKATSMPSDVNNRLIVQRELPRELTAANE